MKKGQIIENIPVRVVDQKKGNPLLFLEHSHKFYLMLMNILHGKCMSITFFCIKTHRDSLYDANIVYRTFLVKICKGNMSGFLVYRNWFNGCGNLLNQSHMFFHIFFI